MKNELLPESFSNISDDELMRRLSELLNRSRRVEVELVAHIGEVDARRLFASKASSMFVFCTKVLHLSEHETYLRIGVARAARTHPILLEMLTDGRLHLSGIARLAPLLTEDNRETVLARAVGMSKREIEELVAELSPKDDVPATIRKLPDRREKTKPNSPGQLVPERVEVSTSQSADRPTEDVKENLSRPVPTPSKPAVVAPLSPARYRVQFTASDELRDKLERLRALMRSSVPDGDLATILEEAVTEKLERLESKRFGKTKAPRKTLEETDTSASSRYIPAAVRRAVYERDGAQCAFVDDNGHRCTERHRLEFHHRRPFGRGGGHDLENIELQCRTHNTHHAERDYGREVVERYRRSPDRVFEPSAFYTVRNRAYDLLVPERVQIGAPLTDKRQSYAAGTIGSGKINIALWRRGCSVYRCSGSGRS